MRNFRLQSFVRLVKYFIADKLNIVRVNESIEEMENVVIAYVVPKDQKLDYTVFMLRGATVDW